MMKNLKKTKKTERQIMIKKTENNDKKNYENNGRIL